MARVGKFADDLLLYDDGTDWDADMPNELWGVTDGELKAVQIVLAKLRAAQHRRAQMKLSDRLRLIWPNHKEPNEAADLLDECENALEAIVEDQITGGGDDTFPIAKTLLAKLGAHGNAAP